MSDAPALITSNAADRIALRGVRIRSRVAGMAQKTIVEQTFVNGEDRPVEAIYTFPLPENAAACGFEIVTCDRVLTGCVDERERATELYMNAVAEGHGGYLLERQRPDVFTINVGNLKPKQAVRISLTYVAELTVTDNEARIVFPTTVAPRYATTTATDPVDAMLDADALNPPHVLEVPYGLTLEVGVDRGRPLRSVGSPTHALKTELLDGARYRLTFAAAGAVEMDRDVVIRLELPGEQQPCAQVATGPDGASYLAVTFVPEFDDVDTREPRPAEAVFVIDCSGSMEGDSIERAKTALELCLRSMRIGDRFNVCRFGSTFELMHPQGVRYSEETLAAAIDYVRRLRADLGGTELHAPLEAVLKTPATPGTTREIVLLTDGQVTNEPAMFRLARRHRHHNRIFAFGIGAAPSASLVRGLARATRGASELIAAGEDITGKVLRTFSQMASPAVTDVAVDFAGAEVTAAPAELPPIFEGDALTVFARLAGQSPHEVTLRANVAGAVRQWTVPVRAAADPGAAIATMWARRMIEDLEAPAAEAPGDAGARERLLRVSRTFGVLCADTAFVALEHRTEQERTGGQPALRRVPVMLAAGWGGLERMRAGATAAMARCVAPSARLMLRRSVEILADSVPLPRARTPRLERAGDAGAGGSPPGDGPRPSSDGAVLYEVLSLQTATGAFGWSRAAEELLAQFDGADLCRAAVAVFVAQADTLSDPADVERTVLMLLLLQRRFGALHRSWRRAYDKAVRQLTGRLGIQSKTVERWLSETAAMLIPR
jgi:Ca-activated chloride channel family protein